MNIKGKVWKYGENIDTDVIIPGRYCHLSDPQELAKYCMADLDPDFVHKVTPGDLILAGPNFGCGSSREVAPISIKASGIAAVVASSFARIFYRNAINIGLPIFECPAAYEGTEEGQILEIRANQGIIRNLETGAEFKAESFPPFMQRIMALGGLKGYVEERLATRKNEGTGTTPTTRIVS